MGGIAGIHCLNHNPSDAERGALAEGSTFGGQGAVLSAKPRSTLARTDELAVVVAGHFDRAPATGQSAAEILLEAWSRQGPDALAHFEGAWVAAIWEARDHRLHLVRDPFGIRRIFYASDGGNAIAFASRLRPLLGVPWVSRELARENLAEYLSFRYVHAPRTLFRDVSTLPAGHRLVHDASGTRVLPWFRLRYAPPYSALPDDGEAVAELERRLNRAVAARASGKERVGVFLSGGLDSSAITMVASRLGPVHTFTVGVSDSEDDETPYAGRVATILRTKHEVVRVDCGSFLAGFDEMVGATDQPITDPAAIPQFLLARAARQHVDVVLTGDGGDEIFGGRMVGLLASQLRLSTWLRRIPGPPRTALAALLHSTRPELREPGVPFGLARLIGGVISFDRTSRLGVMRDPGWVRQGIRRVCLEPFYREVVSDPVNEILHVYLRGRMPEDALTRTGAAAGLADVGLRAPLLDRDLVGWCAAQPGPWKVRGTATGTITKWPLRELLRPVLARTLVTRPKRVLPGPWRRWFAGPLRGFLESRVRQLKEDPLKLFLPGAIDSLVARLEEPGVDAQLWTLIFLDAWIREVGPT